MNYSMNNVSLNVNLFPMILQLWMLVISLKELTAIMWSKAKMWWLRIPHTFLYTGNLEIPKTAFGFTPELLFLL